MTTWILLVPIAMGLSALNTAAILLASLSNCAFLLSSPHLNLADRVNYFFIVIYGPRDEILFPNLIVGHTGNGRGAVC